MEAVQSISRSASAGRLQTLAWAVIGLVLVTYGLIAFNAGTKISPAMTEGGTAAAKVDYIRTQSDQGVAMADTAEALEVIPFWIRLIGKIESSEYALGSDSIMETEQHYYAMPETKRNVLGTHMMLGIVLMTAGFFQFWPSFRRKHRTAHRVLGVTYVLAAVSSMSMSSYYLLNTSIDDVYSQFIFYAGLWALVGISMGSIGMAIWSIYQRNIAAHLGWQALAFGCFLTAPIQRFMWIGLSPLSNGRTFNEVNILVNVALLPLAFLAGYALFCANRASSPLRQDADVTAPIAPWIKQGLVGLASIAFLLTAIFLSFAGLEASEITRGLTMPDAARTHDAVLSGGQGFMLTAMLGLVLLFGVRLLMAEHTALKTRGTEVVALAGVAGVSSAVMLLCGYRLGMPSHEQSLAGVGYALNGALLLLFAVLALRQFGRGETGKLHEALWFVVLLSMSPALMYVTLFALHAIGLVPSPYDQQGHGYQLAAGVALLTPILVGHVRAVYSRETRRHAIN